MQYLVDTYGKDNASICLSHHLDELYPDTVAVCGGCPFCRAWNRRASFKDLPIYLHLKKPPEEASEYLNYMMLQKFRGYNSMIITRASRFGKTSRMDLIHLLGLLVEAGIQQIILPEGGFFSKTRDPCTGSRNRTGGGGYRRFNPPRITYWACGEGALPFRARF